MNQEQRRMADFGAQSEGTEAFSAGRRCISLMYVEYITLDAPYPAKSPAKKGFPSRWCN
jgi:hypothetical protein